MDDPEEEAPPLPPQNVRPHPLALRLLIALGNIEGATEAEVLEPLRVSVRFPELRAEVEIIEPANPEPAALIGFYFDTAYRRSLTTAVGRMTAKARVRDIAGAVLGAVNLIGIPIVRLSDHRFEPN